MSERMFPVLLSSADLTPDLPRAVPWSALYEDRAMKNHSQTLKRLAERGGLGWSEIECVILDRAWDGRIFWLPKERDAYVASERAAAARVMALLVHARSPDVEEKV